MAFISSVRQDGGCTLMKFTLVPQLGKRALKKVANPTSRAPTVISSAHLLLPINFMLSFLLGVCSSTLYSLRLADVGRRRAFGTGVCPLL